MKYFAIKARNLDTNQTILAQDLSGVKFREYDRASAERAAENFAERTSHRTGHRWVGIIKLVSSAS